LPSSSFHVGAVDEESPPEQANTHGQFNAHLTACQAFAFPRWQGKVTALMQTEDYEYLYQLEENFWWFAGMRAVTAALLDPFLSEERDRVILDAGCGTGGNLAWLRRYVGAGRVVGLDYVNTALRFCQQNGERFLVQASATDLPFADAAFDLVTSFDVLVQIPGASADEQALCEMWRVLKAGRHRICAWRGV
jgi:SAM-dependent methyltransferase